VSPAKRYIGSTLHNSMLLTQTKVPQVLPIPPEAADLRRKRKRPQQPSRDPRD